MINKIYRCSYSFQRSGALENGNYFKKEIKSAFRQREKASVDDGIETVLNQGYPEF